MSIAKITEISASSKKSFEDAVRMGVRRASKTLDNIEGAWVQDMKVDVEGGKVTGFRVILKVTFVLND
jgi:flavin-binding protein dodecin